MTEPTPSSPTRLPPRWVIRSVWIGHRDARPGDRHARRSRSAHAGRSLRDASADDGRAQDRQAARGHARLHRGRPEPGDPGHERLGLPRSRPGGSTSRPGRTRSSRPSTAGDRSTVGPRSARSASACGRPSRRSAASATTSTRSRAGVPARRPSSSWSHAPADDPGAAGQATAMTILPRTVPDSTWATAAAASSNG